MQWAFTRAVECGIRASGRKWTRIDLTLPGSAHDSDLPQEVERYLGDTWAKFSRLLAEAGIRQYVRIVESHGDGTPHLHVLVDRSWTQHKVKKAWMECGGGYQVWVGAVDEPHGAADYLCKYFTRPLPPGRGRRFGTSAGFPLDLSGVIDGFQRAWPTPAASLTARTTAADAEVG